MILEDVRYQRKRIDNLNERIMRLRSAMVIGERHLDAAPTKTSVRNKLEDDMCKLDELERQLIGEVVALETLNQEADDALDAIDVPDRYKFVAELRYRDALPWRLVGKSANYSVAQCKRICYVVSEKMSRNELLG